VVGLVFSVLFYRSRIPSIAAAAILAGYVGFQYVQKQNALEFAQAFVNEKGLTNVQISAQARPVSPFNWTVFVTDDEAHRFAHVNLKREFLKIYQPGDGFVAKLDAGYLPLERAIWVTRPRYGETDGDLNRQAWNSDALGAFRWFAELPALDGVAKGCAWFVDLRFLTPGRDFMPFRFGACRGEPGAAWRLVAPAD
jgi:inner membrane protein